ncbi:hypothetical protein FLM48_03915 [Shewanella sp. Scap07]|uniref:dienelactone hydrolase family protein n=1 Tax=Shewanella sp. Scap07 TaxID=2589987 RepID=UPI0015BE041A|nr:dienelactone hydrolase family protein [Shewanella sp. Scap07]QLE84310.1 hypothetical protein FLM48_03915 [Shewanella sp. Scap07]
MRIVIATDIFGKTPEFSRCLESFPFAYHLVDPYQGKYQSFADEHSAYQYFINNVGINAYAGHLAQVIQADESPTVVIGFSVGAAALWQASAMSAINHVVAGFGYYGSQIRHQIELQPQFELQLVFPRTEPSFDVGELVNQLAATAKVNAVQCQYLHGFINPLSVNFHPRGCADALQYLTKQVGRLSDSMTRT